MTNSSHPDEAERLSALHALDILDTPEEEAFDRLTRIAAAVFKVPTVLIALMDRDREWFKSRMGFAPKEIDRLVSFCTHAIGEAEPLMVPDARADARFADNPLVTDSPGIRFYAGAQLRTRENIDLGTFCIVDHEPRPALSPQELAVLEDLAAVATRSIEDRQSVLTCEAQADQLRLAEEQARSAKELAEASAEAMRALFSRVSHDLRTPLAAISGFAELLADSPLTAEQASDVEEIRRGARDLLVMIDSLLKVARGTEDA